MLSNKQKFVKSLLPLDCDVSDMEDSFCNCGETKKTRKGQGTVGGAEPRFVQRKKYSSW